MTGGHGLLASGTQSDEVTKARCVMADGPESGGGAHAAAETGGPTFLDLARAGQAKLQAGNRKGAIPLYVAAIRKGCANERTLSVVHSQLGNCLLSEGMVSMAIKHHQADLAITRKLGDHSGAAKSWANLGHANKAKKDYPAAVRCYEQQLLLGTSELADTDTHRKALANMGHAYLSAGMDLLLRDDDTNSDELACEALCRARDAFRLQLQLAEEAKDPDGVAQACGYLGNLFEQAGDAQLAIRFYKRRLAAARRGSDAAAEGRTHCNLGNAFRALGEFDTAIDHYGHDLAICVRLGDRTGEAVTCGNLAAVHQARGDVPKTVEMIRRQMAITESLRDAPAFLRAVAHLGRVHTAVGDYAAAVTAYEKMASVAEATKDGRALKEASDALRDARAALASGATVTEAEASAALERALGEDDAPRHKWTAKGTLSRMFGRKRKGRPSIVVAPGVGQDNGAGGGGGGGGEGPADESAASSASPASSSGSSSSSGNDATSGVPMRRKKPSAGTMRARMKRLSSLFRAGSQAQGPVFLPPGTSGGGGGAAGDDDGLDRDETDIEFDELIFTLTQLEQQARRRHKDDLRQLGQTMVNPMFEMPGSSGGGGGGGKAGATASSAAHEGGEADDSPREALAFLDAVVKGPAGNSQLDASPAVDGGTAALAPPPGFDGGGSGNGGGGSDNVASEAAQARAAAVDAEREKERIAALLAEARANKAGRGQVFEEITQDL